MKDDHLLALARNVRAGLQHAIDYDDEIATIYNALLAAKSRGHEPAAPARPEAETALRPADLYEAHINTHMFKAPTYEQIAFTNCDRCGEQYGARYVRLCSREPARNTGDCTCDADLLHASDCPARKTTTA